MELEPIQFDLAGGLSIQGFDVSGTCEIDAGGPMMTVKENGVTITEFGAISPDGHLLLIPEAAEAAPGVLPLFYCTSLVFKKRISGHCSIV